MSIKTNYKHTLAACFIGYATQALTVTFVPLLFVTFNNIYGISFNKITVMITVSFVIQLLADALSVTFVKVFGYRNITVASNLLVAIGIMGLGVFLDLFNNSFFGYFLATVLYALGGGLQEVCFNPIAESCPVGNKSGILSFLHSFFCWGSVIWALISTVYFKIFGTENFKILCFVFGLIPLLNAIYFCFVPINAKPESEEGVGFGEMLKSKEYIIMLLLMVTAGASEQAISQWSSAFAETGLKVSKSTGDLLGPCLFGVLMGIARVAYTKVSKKISLKKFMSASAGLCIVSYCLAAFSSIPVVSLLGCGLCGLSVGIMWPGTVAMAAEKFNGAGTKMYAVLALFGDLGCVTGPTLVGALSGYGLRTGLSVATVFPIIMLLGLYTLKTKKKNKKVL